MATAQNPYQPSKRLIDDQEALAMLYIEQDLTVCEIADEHSEYSKTTVYKALVDHHIIDKGEDCDTHSCRGIDPPQSQTKQQIDWTQGQ